MSVEVVKPARVYPRNTFAIYICLVGRARKCYTPFTVDTGTDTATVDAHINLSLTIAFYANNVAIELAVYLPGAGYIEVSILALISTLQLSIAVEFQYILRASMPPLISTEPLLLKFISYEAFKSDLLLYSA